MASSEALLRSLLATARITGVAGLALTAPACKKVPAATAPDATAPDGPSAVDSAAGTDAVPDPGVDPEAALPALERDADGNLTEASQQVCREAWTQDALYELDYGDYVKSLDGKRPRASATSASCCRAWTHPSFAPRWGCCALGAIPEDQRLFCTPWGPPAPPRMAALG